MTEKMKKTTIKDLEEIYQAKKMKIKEGRNKLSCFGFEHGLTDKETLDLFRISMKIFDK